MLKRMEECDAYFDPLYVYHLRRIMAICSGIKILIKCRKYKEIIDFYVYYLGNKCGTCSMMNICIKNNLL